jgi:hypothetical protein
MASAAAPKKVALRDNIVRDCATRGIYVSGKSSGEVAGVVVSGNIVAQASTAAMGLYTNARRLTIAGNMVSGSPATAYYLDAAEDIDLIGNGCLGAQGAAVQVEAGASINIRGNTLHGYGKNT